MEELCDRIKIRLLLKIKASAARRGENLDTIQLYDRLDDLMNEMADFLVEKFNDVWGI